VLPPTKNSGSPLDAQAILHTTSDFSLQDLGEILMACHFAQLSWRAFWDDAVRLRPVSTAWEGTMRKFGTVSLRHPNRTLCVEMKRGRPFL